MYRVFPENGSPSYLCTVGYIDSGDSDDIKRVYNTEGTVFMTTAVV